MRFVVAWPRDPAGAPYLNFLMSLNGQKCYTVLLPFACAIRMGQAGEMSIGTRGLWKGKSAQADLFGTDPRCWRAGELWLAPSRMRSVFFLDKSVVKVRLGLGLVDA